MRLLPATTATSCSPSRSSTRIFLSTRSRSGSPTQCQRAWRSDSTRQRLCFRRCDDYPETEVTGIRRPALWPHPAGSGPVWPEGIAAVWPARRREHHTDSGEWPRQSFCTGPTTCSIDAWSSVDAMPQGPEETLAYAPSKFVIFARRPTMN